MRPTVKVLIVFIEAKVTATILAIAAARTVKFCSPAPAVLAFHVAKVSAALQADNDLLGRQPIRVGHLRA
jgi:hypothetical protein